MASPASSTLAVNEARSFRALPRDRSRRRVEHELEFEWQILDGEGALANPRDQEVSFTAPAQAGLVRLGVRVTQRDGSCAGEALITITESLVVPSGAGLASGRGPAGLHLGEGRGQPLAFTLRSGSQYHRDQQRASCFCVRRAQPSAEAALSGATLYQGVGAAQFFWSTGRATAREDDRIDLVHRRKTEIIVRPDRQDQAAAPTLNSRIETT